MSLYYEGILVAEFLTNQSMTVEEALELIEFDENEFCRKEGFFDGIDYNEFHFVAH